MRLAAFKSTAQLARKHVEKNSVRLEDLPAALIFIEGDININPQIAAIIIKSGDKWRVMIHMN